MSKKVKITPAVREVLAAGTTTDGVYRLPDHQLDRKLYQEVAKALEALGGKWDRKVKGFPVSGAFESALDEALDKGVAVNQDKMLGFFRTPRALADFAAAKLDVWPGSTLLEPSAGDGALLDAVERVFGKLPPTIALEIDPGRSDALFAARPEVMVQTQDFMEWRQSPAFLSGEIAPLRIDRILMNPPFGNRVELAHVLRALDFLAPHGRLVAILPGSVRTNSGSAYEEFRARLSTMGHAYYPNPDDAFKESGTMVRTVTLVVDKPEPQPPERPLLNKLAALRARGSRA